VEVSPRSEYRYRGKLRAFRLNGQLRVPEEAIEELLTPVDAPAESDGGEP
jgi:hypothetical protein